MNQFESIVKQAKVIISYDTGLMQIAVALKKKIIYIWSNIVPEFGMFQYQQNPDLKIIEQKT